jgi:hypothetical protein
MDPFSLCTWIRKADTGYTTKRYSDYTTWLWAGNNRSTSWNSVDLENTTAYARANVLFGRSENNNRNWNSGHSTSWVWTDLRWNRRHSDCETPKWAGTWNLGATKRYMKQIRQKNEGPHPFWAV